MLGTPWLGATWPNMSLVLHAAPRPLTICQVGVVDFVHPALASTGSNRSRRMRSRIARNNWRGTATSAIWNVTYRA